MGSSRVEMPPQKFQFLAEILGIFLVGFIPVSSSENRWAKKFEFLLAQLAEAGNIGKLENAQKI